MEQSKKQKLDAARVEIKAYWGACGDAEANLGTYHSSPIYEKLLRRSPVAASVVDASISTVLNMSHSGMMNRRAQLFFIKNRDEISNFFLGLLEREVEEAP